MHVEDTQRQEFYNALRNFSSILATYGSTALDRLLLTALSHESIQASFIERLIDGQFFLNAQITRSIEIPGFSKLVVNFCYLPPKLSFLSLSFAVVLEDTTGAVKELINPYFPQVSDTSAKRPSYTVGSIYRTML